MIECVRTALPDPVPTLARCPRASSGCPRSYGESCPVHQCPGAHYERFGVLPRGLFDVDGCGEVVRTDVGPMEVSTEDFDTGWFPREWGDRGKAAAWYANENGCEFIEVRVTVEWLRAIDEYEDGRLVAGWCDGPIWHACTPTDEGAYAFWRCELR